MYRNAGESGDTLSQVCWSRRNRKLQWLTAFGSPGGGRRIGEGAMLCVWSNKGPRRCEGFLKLICNRN
jgi:hypothetical protein